MVAGVPPWPVPSTAHVLSTMMGTSVKYRFPVPVSHVSTMENACTVVGTSLFAYALRSLQVINVS